MITNTFKNENTTYALIFLIICGTILRLWHITQNSFWIDEMATIHFSTGNFIDIWNYTANGEFNPPLFYWLESIVMQIFGVSELTMRFIPAIAGVLTIPVMYIITKKFTENEYIALISSGLMTFSIFMVYYAQEARAYTLALLFYMLAMVYYIDFITVPNTKQIRYVMLFSILAIYTHFYAAIGVLVFIIHLLYIRLFVVDFIKELIRKEGIWIISAFIVMLPLIDVTIDLFKSRTGMGVDWGADAYFLISNIFIQSSGFSIVICVIFIIAAIIGIVNIKNLNTFDKHFNVKRTKQIFLILGILIPVISTIILSNMISMSVRYLIYIVPYFYLALVSCLIPFYDFINIIKDNKIKLHQMLIIFTLILLFMTAFINIPSLITFHSQVTKADYRGVANYLYENTSDEDVIILLPEERKTAFNYYYKGNNIIYYANKYDVDALKQTINSNSNKQIYIVQVVVSEYVNKNAEMNILLAKYEKREFFAINIYNITSKFNGDD